jgi:hypothetical protein
MTDFADLPPNGTIVIEWAKGHDPNKFDTYAWGVKCDPLLPDEVVSGILSEVLRVY